MNLLAVDTARSEGSVALLLDGSVTAIEPLGAGPGFGEVLFGAIERLLAGQPARLGDIDAFAAATGPGSFTGIRVGLVAAKAFAEAHSKPLVGISSLRALAYSAGGKARRASLLDARRGEVFAGHYDRDALPLSAETLGTWDDLSPRLAGAGLLVVANEPHLFEPGGSAAAAAGLARHIGPATLAREVAMLAAREIKAGKGRRPEEVEANYIRRPRAEPPAFPLAGRR